MRILSVTGFAHRIVVGTKPRHIDFINNTGLLLMDVISYTDQYQITYDAVIITDEALPAEDYSTRLLLQELLVHISKSQVLAKVCLVTGNVHLVNYFNELKSKYPNFEVYYVDKLRVPLDIYKSVLTNCSNKMDQASAKSFERIHDEDANQISLSPEPIKKAEPPITSFFNRFKMKKDGASKQLDGRDDLSKELDKISLGVSRVVAITGHRGSGVTSTVVNTAYEASQRGLKTIAIDLDMDFRGINVYLNQFSASAETDSALASSLMGLLAKPQDYKLSAVNINEKLWVSGLGYTFKDQMLMEKFFTSHRLIGLISVLKQHFNLVLLDMPLELFEQFREVLFYIDTFGVCIPNNLYAVLSLLRSLDIRIDEEDLSYINSKVQVIVTKYNERSVFQDEIFTPKKVCQLLTSGIVDLFHSEVGLCGTVPYNPIFDQQVESGTLVVQNSTTFKKAYGEILLRLIGGK